MAIPETIYSYDNCAYHLHPSLGNITQLCTQAVLSMIIFVCATGMIPKPQMTLSILDTMMTITVL